MLKRAIISFAAFGLSFLLGYMVSNNYLIGILCGFLFSLTIFLYVCPRFQARREKSERRGEAYRFVNSFVISLSVNGSLEESFQSASLFLSPSLKEVTAHLSNLDIIEKIRYLQRFFEESFYEMFCSMVEIWRQQGGDVLNLMQPLLREVSETEESERIADKSRARAFGQFLLLWVMSAFVLVAVRLGLSSFYASLSTSLAFQLVSVAYFVIASGSFVLFSFLIGEKGKGGKNDKKKVQKGRKKEGSR